MKHSLPSVCARLALMMFLLVLLSPGAGTRPVGAEEPGKPMAAPQAPQAVCPIVAEFLVGAWTDQGWATSEEIASHVPAGRKYLYFQGGRQVGEGVGQAATQEEGPGVWYDVPLSPSLASLKKGDGDAGAIAVGATWNPLPRPVRLATGGAPEYLRQVGELLAANGMKGVEARVSQVVRGDLDGDGQEEVLIIAQTAEAKVPEFKKNTYSLVFFRRLVKGQVVTQVLAGEYYRQDRSGEASSPTNFAVPAVLDLNGDGKMEIILKSWYYEGSAYEILELQGDSLKAVLSEGVGA